MARTLIATNVIPRNGSLEAITWTPADATNQHYYVDAGDTVLMARNADATTKTVTVVSVADPELGRTGDKAMVVPAAVSGASGVVFFGLPTPTAWRQPGGGKINVNVSASTNLQLAAIQITRR
jgi:hypothetical protein